MRWILTNYHPCTKYGQNYGFQFKLGPSFNKHTVSIAEGVLIINQNFLHSTLLMSKIYKN